MYCSHLNFFHLTIYLGNFPLLYIGSLFSLSREQGGKAVCALGKGPGKEEAGSWEGKEWEKKRERNQPKKVREDRGGPEGGGTSEEEQTEMEWGHWYSLGPFLIFPIHSPAFSLLCQLSEMLCLTGSLSQISYHLKPLGSERWRPRKGSKWVYQCFFTPRELLDTKGKGIKDLKRAQKRESSL